MTGGTGWETGTDAPDPTPAVGGPESAEAAGGGTTGGSAQEGSGGEEGERLPPPQGAGREPDPPLEPDTLMRERDEFRDALQHLQADFENYRKRVAKQTDDLRERAAESLVEKLLPVLDTADLALVHGGGEDVKQLAGALGAALEKEGLERIDGPGVDFDPTLHDAVAHEPGEGGRQEVAEVLRAGYRWRGRVLRPAMVKVRG